MKNKHFVNSFVYAAEGFFAACKNERNLRFHLVVANLICVFAYFFGISKTEWRFLIITIVAVISAELVNTAIEAAVDTATEEISSTAKIAKDASAAAVLVLAIGAVVLGVSLFGNVEKITYTLKNIFTNAKILFPCLMLGAADLLFLFGFKKRK